MLCDIYLSAFSPLTCAEASAKPLASNTIEEHLVQLIEKKANLFMAYAHESAIKDSSNMASDPDTGSLERELLELLRAEEDDND